MRSTIYHFYQIVKSSLNVRRKEKQRGSQSFRGGDFGCFGCDTSTTSATLSAFPGEGRNRNGGNRHVKYNAICSLSIRIRCTYCVHMFRQCIRAYTGRADSSVGQIRTRKISCTRELRIRQQRINGSAGSEIFNVLNNITRLTFSNDTFFFSKGLIFSFKITKLNALQSI